MPYEPVTPAQFKQAKPQFEEADDAIVQGYLTTAELYVDESWPERFYQPAIIAVTCHLMTLDGQGTDGASQSFAQGLTSYQSIKSGDFSLTRFRDQAQSAGLSTSAWFNQTPCGQQYMMWVRSFKGGPRVAIGAGCCTLSTYAKDLYRDSWWPGC